MSIQSQQRSIFVDGLERRRCFNFALLDPAFAVKGVSGDLNRGDTQFFVAAYPLYDGGSIVRHGACDFTRFDSAGARVTKFGVNGTLDLPDSTPISYVAVDATTGRLAIAPPCPRQKPMRRRSASTTPRASSSAR